MKYWSPVLTKILTCSPSTGRKISKTSPTWKKNRVSVTIHGERTAKVTWTTRGKSARRFHTTSRKSLITH
ncbi:MAG: hypothetical protein GY950_25195 [bacterium]|nr:hypothetical protein [bacterium]